MSILQIYLSQAIHLHKEYEMKVVYKFAKWLSVMMKRIQEYAKMFWTEIVSFFMRPWTVGRIFSLLGKIVLTAFVIFIVTLAVTVSTLPRVRVATPDEKIVAYCAAAPERQVEIKYETKLWMLLNRPENPRVSQGWGFGLTDAQMIAFLKIGDGVNPCPWSEGR